MFDRQRSSKPQLQRKVASKTREQLETDASQKEAQLLELRSTMSKEKAEIDELMSQRGLTLWTSSSKIRASTLNRQACPTRLKALNPKPSILAEVTPLKQHAQQPVRKQNGTATRGGCLTKPGPMLAPSQEAAPDSACYRPSPTRRLSQAPSGKTSGAVSGSQLTVRSTASQRAPAPPRLLPALQSPALQRTSNNQQAATSSSVRIAGSPTDSCNRSADSVVPAQTGGKGGAGSGVAPPGSGIGWGGAGEGVKAGSGLAASSSNRINGMRDNLGDRQERTESMGGCEATPVSNSTSAGQPKTGAKAFAGSSLLEGNFNEDDSHASFADALSSWRGKAAATAIALPGPGPKAAPGTSTQAGAGLMTTGLTAPMNAPALTYFERLFWSQESQNAAAAVTGKTVRSIAEEKQAALQSMS